jgi:phosphate ABC transporter phosphate-binding protein
VISLPTRLRRAALVLAAAGVVVPTVAAPAAAEGYRAVTGSGSTWSANMVEQWTADVKQFGISVNYSSTGSSTGRREFKAGTVDFAVSEIPYGLTDAQGAYDAPPDRGFAYLPIVAGGTSFMYNLKVGGKQVTNLRLSGDNLTKIFTGALTRWDDPALQRDNPKIALPARQIVPVVRSDGSGTTAQFTAWMAKEHGSLWNAFCTRQGISYAGSCPFTSNYPSVKGFVSQSGSLGVSGYVSTPSAEGAINYVEYSYALRAKFPVVKLLNGSGYYVEPTDEAVAVGLLGAKINSDKSNRDTYLTQILDGVYRNADRRSYPLSSYSYMVIPTAEGGTFKEDKGRALGDFLYYSICEGQQAAGVLGYSPLPQNLVQAGIEQVKLIPGVDVQNVTLDKCNNPTFSSDGTNTLAKTAPQPPACDKQGADQCLTGTGGARGPAVRPAAGTGTPRAGSAGSPAVSSAGGAGAGGPSSGPGTPAGGVGTAVATAGGVAPATVDPLTGQPVTAPADGAVTAELVAGVALTVPVGTGGATQAWYMVLAALALLGAAVGPPLVLQRTRRGDA